MVVNAEATSPASTLTPAATFVAGGAAAGPLGGSDYQAAVQAASQGAEGWDCYSILVCSVGTHMLIQGVQHIVLALVVATHQ